MRFFSAIRVIAALTFFAQASPAEAAEVSFSIDCRAYLLSAPENVNRMHGTMTFRDDPSVATLSLPVYLPQSTYWAVLTLSSYQAEAEKSTFAVNVYEETASGLVELNAATARMRLDGTDQITVSSELAREKDTLQTTCDLAPVNP